VSRTLQDLWLDFAKNSENGSKSSGLKPYAEGEGAKLMGATAMLLKRLLSIGSMGFVRFW